MNGRARHDYHSLLWLYIACLKINKCTFGSNYDKAQKAQRTWQLKLGKGAESGRGRRKPRQPGLRTSILAPLASSVASGRLRLINVSLGLRTRQWRT